METIDFSKINVLVIGDVMLDIYYKGSVERISPEAPVPVVRVNSIDHGLGGAAMSVTTYLILVRKRLSLDLWEMMITLQRSKQTKREQYNLQTYKDKKSNYN